MAKVQKQFEEFHNTIKLTGENDILRKKRDIILDKLKENISDEAPNYTTFNQGSYAMNTGIVPLDGDYDIDVGICFEIDKDDYEDPVDVKKWVHEALDGHTKSVKVKDPCVTVTYTIGDEPAYHVDLAIYSANNPDDKLYLAKGKLNSATENRYWEESDPKGFKKTVQEHFSDADDRKQFRRVIRYLKRWKDEKFSSAGHAAPIGIALTVAALNLMMPVKDQDLFANTSEYNDLKALKALVNSMIAEFKYVSNADGDIVERWVLNIPTPPYNDLYEKMTDNQMVQFKEKLQSLLSCLNEAESEVDPVEACEKLQDQFGDDFPVPPKDETGAKKRAAVVTSSASAS